MRRLCLLLVGLSAGCATTVQRLDGEMPTRMGPARSDCEKQAWLVIVPTRYESPNPGYRSSSPHSDGLGLYQVGAADPESIPGRAPELGHSPLLDRHVAGVRAHDRQRLASGMLAGAGLVAIGIGTGLLVSAFETRHVTQDGEPTTRQHIDSTRSIAGAVVIGVGFGLGITGLVVSPSYAERAQADALRYAFQPPTDDRDAVRELVAVHNQRVRERCPASEPPAPPPPASAPPAPAAPAEPTTPPPAAEPAPAAAEPDGGAAPSGD